MAEEQRELLGLVGPGGPSVSVEPIRAALQRPQSPILQDLADGALPRGEGHITPGDLLVRVTNYFLSELSWTAKYTNRWSNAYVAQTKGLADVLQELTQALGCADEFGQRFARIVELYRPVVLERYEFIKKLMHAS